MGTGEVELGALQWSFIKQTLLCHSFLFPHKLYTSQLHRNPGPFTPALHSSMSYIFNTHACMHTHTHTHAKHTHTHTTTKNTHTCTYASTHACTHARTHTVVSYNLDLSHTFITVIYDLQFLHTHCSMTLSFHTLMSHKADLSYTCYITRLSYTNTLIFHLDLSYIDVSQLSP